MDAALQVLQNYNKIIVEGAAVLAVLTGLILLARILKHIKRLNKSLSSITGNMQEYFDVILSEDTEEESGEERKTAEQEQAAAIKKVRAAEQQEKEEEEKIVNAVLQEYFS